MRSVRLAIALAAAIGVAAAGCSHAPEYRDWDSKHPTVQAADVAPLAKTDAQVAIFKDRNFSIAGIDDTICAAGGKIAGTSEAEYTVTLDARSKGDPSGWNFLIAWPGFLIFMPAWHGLIYKYDVDVVASIRDASGRALPPVKVRREYEVRHTAVWQGVLIESGWIIWYSLPALAGGVVTATAPPDLSEINAHLPEKERRAIGTSVGRALVRALAADAENLAILRAKAAAKAKAAGTPIPPVTAGPKTAPSADALKPSRKGGLRIASTPDGAAVFVNDLYVGEAPVEVWPRPGKHRVVVSLAGYESVYEEVEVGADGLAVQTELKALPAPAGSKGGPGAADPGGKQSKPAVTK